jgi:hypothetical protein
VNRDAFLQILKQGHANDDELDAVRSFCPCHLVGNTSERELLLDLLLARQEGATAPDLLRRQTLLLLLDLSERQGTHGLVPLDEAFKAACLTGALEPVLWTVTEPAARGRLGDLQRNDLLSIAALGLFGLPYAVGPARRGSGSKQRVRVWVGARRKRSATWPP